MNKEEERYLRSSPAQGYYTKSKSKSKSSHHHDHTAHHPPPEPRSSKLFVYVLFLVVLLSIIFLIFGSVVLLVRPPTLRISNVLVRDLRRRNATLVAEMRLRNTNFGRFKFRTGNATLVLAGNGTVFAAGRIAEGFVSRRGVRGFNVTMKMWSENMSSGVSMVELRSTARLRGEVRVAKIVSRWRSAVMNCSMGLNLTSQAIQDLSCQ